MGDSVIRYVRMGRTGWLYGSGLSPYGFGVSPGLMSKYCVAFYGVGVVAGLLGIEARGAGIPVTGMGQ